MAAIPAVAPELRRYALVRQQFLAQVCRRREITRTEFDALDELSQHGGLTPGQLGQALSLTSGSVTALLDRLERLGWTTRERHPDDRRKVVVRLTDTAEAVGEEEIGPLVMAVLSAAGRFSKRDQQTIARFLASASDTVAELLDS
jgi:DNA-binding MarR family transcriptional regulator